MTGTKYTCGDIIEAIDYWQGSYAMVLASSNSSGSYICDAILCPSEYLDVWGDWYKYSDVSSVFNHGKWSLFLEKAKVISNLYKMKDQEAVIKGLSSSDEETRKYTIECIKQGTLK